MNDYFKLLIWMILFVIVIEMIFPDSAYRKYIKLVLGCILMYTLLTPIVSLIKVDGADYKAYVERYEKLLGNGSGAEGYEKQFISGQEELKEAYKHSIKTLVEQQVEVSVQQVQLETSNGEISKIRLLVGKKEEPIHIGTIHIGDKSQTVDGEEEQLKNKIKTCLCDFYNVQVQNIYITVQKN